MPRKRIPKNTENLLIAASSGVCALCGESLFKEGVFIGTLAHIQPVSPGGPRGDVEDVDDVNSYDNIVVLCPNCHKIVDTNESEYTAERLRKIKLEHEQSVAMRLPSALESIISAICRIDESEVLEYDFVPYAIEKKIDYNCLSKTMVTYIREYAKYTPFVERFYQVLEEEGSKASHILRQMRGIYLSVLEEFDDSPLEVQTHANEILREVVSRVSVAAGAKRDQLYAVWILVVDAFIRCKILEKPKNL